MIHSSPTTRIVYGANRRCCERDHEHRPVKIAEQVINPVRLQVDATYVYWATSGTGANPNGTLVRRRRCRRAVSA